MYVAPNDPKQTKNAVALWTEQNVFSWDEFLNTIVPRFEEMRELFTQKPRLGNSPTTEANAKGKAFIYKLVALLRNFNDVSSAPRLAYLLARGLEGYPNASQISKKFYGWAQNERERRCLIAALEWYVYSTRERD